MGENVSSNRSIINPQEVFSLIEGMMNNGGDFVNNLIDFEAKYSCLPEERRLSPDHYGCEKIFADTFVNEEMRVDFVLIAKDFYAHEFAKLPEYEDVEYLNIESGEDWPERMFNRFTMNMMVNAIAGGSEYTKALIKTLYKTYYKKEYKMLKRFNSLSSREVVSLARPEDGYESYFVGIARVLYAAKLFEILIDPDCNYLFLFLNDYSNNIDPFDNYSFDGIGDNDYEDCLKEVNEKFDNKRLYSLDMKVSKFFGNALKLTGYAPQFIDCCDTMEIGITERWALALFVFKKTYPGKLYSEEDIVLYGAILHAIRALASNSDWWAYTLKLLVYGEEATDYYDQNPPKYTPGEVNLQENSQTIKESAKVLPDDNLSQSDSGHNADEDYLMQELDRLRRKIHKLEADNKELRENLSKNKYLEEEVRRSQSRFEEANKELASLKSYVYSLTESDAPVEDESVATMREAISSLRIVIIGGHPNWVAKLKAQFPKWSFINPDTSGSVDTSVVISADYVFFFTDIISHSKYYQFFNVIRENKINFGYIHEVNIEKNIRNIYRELQDNILVG